MWPGLTRCFWRCWQHCWQESTRAKALTWTSCGTRAVLGLLQEGVCVGCRKGPRMWHKQVSKRDENSGCSGSLSPSRASFHLQLPLLRIVCFPAKGSDGQGAMYSLPAGICTSLYFTNLLLVCQLNGSCHVSRSIVSTQSACCCYRACKQPHPLIIECPWALSDCLCILHSLSSTSTNICPGTLQCLIPSCSSFRRSISHASA